MATYDILIVDDEKDIGRLICDTLEDEGYSTRYAEDGPQAIETIKQRLPNLVVLDIWLGDSRFDGLKVLNLIRQDHPQLPVIMMSGHGTIETAVNAIKMGAYDFVEKPFKMDRLLLVIDRALEAARLKKENEELKSKADDVSRFVGETVISHQINQLIERAAPTNSRVLIAGPSGSGKEIVARLIHKKSKRASGSFVVLNCAFFKPDEIEKELFGIEDEKVWKTGALEQAHHGTLLLDEVSELPLETQGKLVRALQEEKFHRVGGTRKVSVDVRILTSSCRDLKDLVKKGKFREDLFYRLNVVPICVPALKERTEDIPLLVEYFVQSIAASQGLPARKFTDEAIVALQSYEWPGNLRQLKNVIDWILIMSGEDETQPITPDMLPTDIANETPALLQKYETSHLISLPLKEARKQFEIDYFKAQVSRFGGNISHTAAFVEMERSALHRKLKSLNIK